ncbi:hypothetical protein ACRAWD_01585 [Caulobacter segnis]
MLAAKARRPTAASARPTHAAGWSLLPLGPLPRSPSAACRAISIGSGNDLISGGKAAGEKARADLYRQPRHHQPADRWRAGHHRICRDPAPGSRLLVYGDRRGPVANSRSLSSAMARRSSGVRRPCATRRRRSGSTLPPFLRRKREPEIQL